jgi:hypothetical protein
VAYSKGSDSSDSERAAADEASCQRAAVARAHRAGMADDGELLSQVVPWGGFVNCSRSQDCLVAGIETFRLATCVSFAGGLPEGVPLGRYCVW